MSSQDHEVLVKHLSVDRLSSYLASTKGDAFLALALYQWNSSVSSALFHVLGDVEVVLRNAGKFLTHSNIVAALNFGFWRSFLTKQYKDTLWREALRFAFPYSPSRQPEYIFTRVRHLHVLRNRIAHHEPIHNRNVARDFQICIEVLNAISPVIAAWSAKNSRVLEVLAKKPQ